MEELIIQTLKKCRSIEPTAEFKDRSRALILSHPRKRPSLLAVLRREAIENVKFTLALSLTAILLVAVFGGIASWERIFPNGPWQERQNLLTEMETANFEIELREAEYFTESAKEIATLLGEIKNSETAPVDTLLDQIIF